MSTRKPDPMILAPRRRTCPVCGKVSFSQGGTHPQCAVAKADAAFKAARKAVEAATPAPPALGFAAKACPRCGRRVPARRAVCDCGHDFARVATAVP